MGNAINEKGFTISKKKYYLGNVGYFNSNSLLVSYKKVRYHFKKLAIIACCLKNTKELFNLWHSSLCNIIKQIFKVLKKRFFILKVIAKFLLQSQIKIIYAFITLQNFICVYLVEKQNIFE